jgi:hypothetical protein
MNLFDNLQTAMYGTVTHTMGYDATWQPSTGGLQLSARVLFNGPTEQEKINSANYEPDKLEMEYQEGDFEGLKNLTDQNSFETINIVGIGNFTVQSILKKFDGKTNKARLQSVES